MKAITLPMYSSTGHDAITDVLNTLKQRGRSGIIIETRDDYHLYFAGQLLEAQANGTATVQQLRTLPGIGPALAQRIVSFREQNHGFKRVEELLAIPGISEKKWKAIRDKVSVE